MQVQSISNNQQTFNGYVDSNLKESIKKELLKSVKYLDDCKTDLKQERYQVLIGQGKRTIEKLEKFVAPLHKDTSIGMYEKRYLHLSNPITTGRSSGTYPSASGIIIRDEALYEKKNKAYWSNYDKIYADNFSGKDKNLASRYLEHIEIVMDAVNKCIKPKDVNEAFLKLAERDLGNYGDNIFTGIGFIDKFAMKRVAKRIEKYAESIGKTTDAKTIAKKRLEQLTRIKQAYKRNIKDEIGKIIEDLKKVINKKRAPEDKQLTRQYISEVQKLGKNKSA